MDKARLQETIRMAELTHRRIEGNISEAGKEELNNWLNESEQNRRLFEQMQDEDYRENLFNEFTAGDSKAAWQLVTNRINGGRFRRNRNRVMLRRSAAVAALLIGLGIAFYYFTKPDNIKDNNSLATVQKNDVPPGKNIAVLTLANGKQIDLDSNANGLLAQQGSIQIINLAAGQLAYEESKTTASTEKIEQYNTLTTPKGGQYQVILPDGSKVWLNAASSLRYPARFIGKERRVTVTGEAYFEVKHEEKMPFIVSVGNTEIKDIGTEFNIKAYPGNPEIGVTTTVVKGAVSVSGQKNVVLTAGKQALITAGNDVQVRKVPDIKKVIAWKEGLFWFNEESITEVMDQIARWYNVDVEYKGKVTAHFSGSIHRDVNVSVVFKVLEETGGVHFHIQGRKIIVTP